MDILTIGCLACYLAVILMVVEHCVAKANASIASLYEPCPGYTEEEVQINAEIKSSVINKSAPVVTEPTPDEPTEEITNEPTPDEPSSEPTKKPATKRRTKRTPTKRTTKRRSKPTE